MKRLCSFLAAAAAAIGAAACSSGGGQVIVPPPNNGFSNSNLKGQYAFSMTGTLFDSATLSTSPYTRVGVFIADGNGNITGGVEDVNLNLVGSGSPRLSFSGGTYTINSDGRGTLNLTSVGTGGGSLTFSITMTSPSSGYIVDFPSDGTSTASGSFTLQNTNSFAGGLSGVSGSYAFDLSGLDGTGNAESLVGQFVSNGSGTFTSAVVDDNDGGTIAGSGNGVATSGTYAGDNLNAGDLTTFGRGVFTLGGAIQGVFYVVGPNQVKFMETTSGGTLSGDAFLQSNIPTTTAGLSGGFVYVMGGSGTGGAGFGVAGPVTRGGKFSASGGNLSSIIVDSNNAGTQQSSLSGTSGTCTIDTAGTGRGTVTFTVQGQQNPFTYVFYLISPTQGFVQDQSLGGAIIEDGSLIAQGTSSISNSSLAGTYAISWSGVTIANGGNLVGEEDLLGQVTLSNSGSLSGNVDFNEFSSGFQFTQIGLTGTLQLSADPTSHNKLTINLATNPANNGISAFAYIANNNTILFMTTQNVRIAAGVLTPQNP
jgi:hypothetical protein